MTTSRAHTFAKDPDLTEITVIMDLLHQSNGNLSDEELAEFFKIGNPEANLFSCTMLVDNKCDLAVSNQILDALAVDAEADSAKKMEIKVGDYLRLTVAIGKLTGRAETPATESWWVKFGPMDMSEDAVQSLYVGTMRRMITSARQWLSTSRD